MFLELADNSDDQPFPYIRVVGPDGRVTFFREDAFDHLPQDQWWDLMVRLAPFQTEGQLSGWTPWADAMDFLTQMQSNVHDRKRARNEAVGTRRQTRVEGKAAINYGRGSGVVPTAGQTWAPAIPGIVSAAGPLVSSAIMAGAGVPPVGGIAGLFGGGQSPAPVSLPPDDTIMGIPKNIALIGGAIGGLGLLYFLTQK